MAWRQSSMAGSYEASFRRVKARLVKIRWFVESWMMLSELNGQDAWLREQVKDGEGASRLGVERFGAFVVAGSEASVGGQISAKVRGILLEAIIEMVHTCCILA